MDSELVIVPVIFGVIFGIFYLFISARNKERLALIEKGADASIFYGKDRKATPMWKVIIINLALLLYGNWNWNFYCCFVESGLKFR